MILGAFFGLVWFGLVWVGLVWVGRAGLATIVCILGAISLGDTAYGWFSLSVLLVSLTQATITGVGGLHL